MADVIKEAFDISIHDPHWTPLRPNKQMQLSLSILSALTLSKSVRVSIPRALIYAVSFTL
jgi:hypothetical protein